MASKADSYARRIRTDQAMNEADLKAAKAELLQAAIDRLDASTMDNAEAVGALRGAVDVQLGENDRELVKPVGKLTDNVSDKITDNYRDLESAGYQPQVFISDVNADLSDPDQLSTFLRRMSAQGPNPCTPIFDENGAVTNECVGPLPPPAPPPTVPPPPLTPELPPDCVPVGPPDALGRQPMLCTKAGPGEPGSPPPPPFEPPPTTCPAPDINIPSCPAPIIVVQPAPVVPTPPRNPADIQPGECSPGDPTCGQPEPQCPDVPDVNVNNVVNVPPIKFPEPKEEPRFKFNPVQVADKDSPYLNFDTIDGCADAKDACRKWTEIVNGAAGPVQDVTDVISGSFGKWVSNRLGVATTSAGPILNFAFTLFADVKDDSREAFQVRALASRFSQVRILQAAVKNNFGEQAACAMAPAAAAAAMVGEADNLAFDFNYFVQPLKYESQYIFPVYLPEQSGIDALWLGDRVTSDEHTCMTRALGNLPNLHKKLAEEKRERPNTSDLIDTWRRGKITLENLYEEMRKLGWLDRQEAARKIDLSEAVPPFGDIIRFMVRDTENAEAVTAGKLDTDFDKNFQGQLQQWANANGISPDLARRYWRAHWRWISNTEGYEMIHRLRPDRVPDELVTTAEDIKKVLQINDIAPAFIDRLIAISYKPLTRVDVRRAYEIGVLSESDVTEAYLDLGYDQDNATTLTAYVKRDIERKRARSVHVWSLSAVASAYQAGTIDKAFAFSKAAVFLESEEAVNSFLFDVDNKRRADQRKRCISAAKKRYMTGELNYLQGQDAVADIVPDRDIAVSIVNEWDCERSSRRKEIAAGTLCKWLGQGLIDVPTYVTRLGNLGYTEDDAKRMLASCSQDIFEKEKKAAIAAARQSLQQYQKRQAELKAAIKEAEKKLKEYQAQIDAGACNGVAH